VKKNTASINSKQFGQSFAKNPLSSFYLFLGEEDAEKEKFILKISAKIFGKAPPEIRRFHVDTGDLMAAAEYLLSESMFSSQKVAVLVNADSLQKKDSPLLEQIFKDISKDAVAIFLCTQNKPPAMLNKYAENFTPVIFWRMFETDLINYIVAFFSDNKRQIDRKAANLIVTLTGRDLSKVDEAVNRIIDGSNESVITENIVYSLLTDEKTIKVFDFISSFFGCRKDMLQLLIKILDDGLNELFILSLINKRAVEIDRYHSMIAAGEVESAAIDKSLSNSKDEEEFRRQCSLFPEKKIRRIIKEIYHADLAFKSGSIGTEILSNPLLKIIELAAVK